MSRNKIIITAVIFIALLFSSTKIDGLLNLTQGTVAGILGMVVLFIGFVLTMISMLVRWRKRQYMHDVSPVPGGEGGADASIDSCDDGGFDIGGFDGGGGGDG